MSDTPEILIVGAGSIGGVVAVLLQERGHNPYLLSKYRDIKEIASTTGLKITGHRGTIIQKVNVLTSGETGNRKFDVIIVATKATDLRDAAMEILPCLKADSLVVSMQNGICTDVLAEIVGNRRTIGCVVGWGATMRKHGEYDMTSGGEFIIGTLDDIHKQKLDVLKSILDDVVPTRISEHIYGELYSKLIINSCINTLGVICGLSLGRMLVRKTCRTIFTGIIDEAMYVAGAMQLNVPAYGGKLDFYRFTASKGFFANTRRHLIILMIGFRYRRLKSSSLQSLERGKPTEIDFFNGFITRKAMKLNVNVPLNEKLTLMVKEIEQGSRKIGCFNFEEPFFRNFSR